MAKQKKAWEETTDKVDESPEPEIKVEKKAEPDTKISDRAKSWIDQTVAKFGNVDIKAGENFLQADPTKITDLPNELQGYWAKPGDDLSTIGYQKADPQPEHHMATSGGMVLWLTRKDMYDARMKAQQEFSQTRMKAAGEEKITGPTPKGASDDIKGVTKEEGAW